MRVVALISGGKDSCFNMMQCVAQGHEIVALANLKPPGEGELDSYMYQTVGHDAIELYSEAMGLPLYRRTIEGDAIEQGRNYTCTTKDEVEDLYELLKDITRTVEFDAVAVGAVLSDYQRVRVENVCSRLNVVCLAYLWRRDQKELFEEMISCHVEAIIIKVAALGLDPQKHLGKSLSEMYLHLCDINKKFDCHICGEGGEYETFTMDCPLFQKRIVMDSSEVVIHSDDAFAPVGYLKLKEMHLQDKVQNEQHKSNGLEDILLHKDHTAMMNEDDIKCLMKEVETDENTAINMSVVFDDEAANLFTNKEVYADEIMTKRSGQFAWISGIKACGCLTHSVIEEADLMMKELEKNLKAVGSDLQHIILVHVYVRNMKDYAEFNSVYGTYFRLNPPARVCVQTDFLDTKLFQLDCLTALSQNCHHGDLTTTVLREAMHVQSISHWAPANIGPYSQAVKINQETTFVAGCIGLCPATMTLVTGGIYREAPLALRHVRRILRAMIPGTTLDDVIAGVCYITTPASVAIATAVWSQHVNRGEARSVMVHVVVPGLPRGAAVEWHVISHRCSSLLEYKLSESCFENMKVSLASCVCPRHHCGSVNASAEFLPPLSTKCSISEMVENLLKSLYGFFTSRGTSPRTTSLMMRVFFRTDVFGPTHDSLKRAFLKAVHVLTSSFHHTTSPALVFVPVTALAKPSQVIAVSSWLENDFSEQQQGPANIVPRSEITSQLVDPRTVHRVSDPNYLVALAEQVSNAGETVKWTATNKLMLIAEQIRHLQQQARDILEEAKESTLLHHAACNFKKIPGKMYHLYRRADGTTYFSMISPDEWGGSCPHEFQGSYKLEHDMTWTKPEDIARRNDDLEEISRFLSKNRPAIDLAYTSEENPDTKKDANRTSDTK